MLSTGVLIFGTKMWMSWLQRRGYDESNGKKSNLRLGAVQLVQTGINQSQLACVSKTRQSLCGRE